MKESHWGNYRSMMDAPSATLDDVLMAYALDYPDAVAKMLMNNGVIKSLSDFDRLTQYLSGMDPIDIVLLVQRSPNLDLNDPWFLIGRNEIRSVSASEMNQWYQMNFRDIVIPMIADGMIHMSPDIQRIVDYWNGRGISASGISTPSGRGKAGSKSSSKTVATKKKPVQKSSNIRAGTTNRTKATKKTTVSGRKSR